MEEYRKKCCLALLLDEQSESEAILLALAETPYHTVIWKSNSTINPNEMLLPEGPMPEVLNTVFEDGFSRGFRKVVILKPVLTPTPSLLDEAFFSLKLIECCIGLNDTGDFYLLGMNDFRPEILSFIPHEDGAVSKKIIRRIGDQKLALYKTPTLKSE
jgi:glycosyltransferase A (GT-A) superfamily protein (DUF2064 family)